MGLTDLAVENAQPHEWRKVVRDHDGGTTTQFLDAKRKRLTDSRSRGNDRGSLITTARSEMELEVGWEAHDGHETYAGDGKLSRCAGLLSAKMSPKTAGK